MLTEESVQLKDLDQLTGKTIAEINDSKTDYLVIQFTDGSYVLLESTTDYDGDVGCPEVYKDTIRDYDKLRLGMINDKEYQLRQAELYKKDLAEREARERAVYERLKTKYEPTV